MEFEKFAYKLSKIFNLNNETCLSNLKNEIIEFIKLKNLYKVDYKSIGVLFGLHYSIYIKNNYSLIDLFVEFKYDFHELRQFTKDLVEFICNRQKITNNKPIDIYNFFGNDVTNIDKSIIQINDKKKFDIIKKKIWQILYNTEKLRSTGKININNNNTNLCPHTNTDNNFNNANSNNHTNTLINEIKTNAQNDNIKLQSESTDDEEHKPISSVLQRTNSFSNQTPIKKTNNNLNTSDKKGVTIYIKSNSSLHNTNETLSKNKYITDQDGFKSKINTTQLNKNASNVNQKQLNINRDGNDCNNNIKPVSNSKTWADIVGKNKINNLEKQCIIKNNNKELKSDAHPSTHHINTDGKNGNDTKIDDHYNDENDSIEEDEDITNKINSGIYDNNYYSQKKYLYTPDELETDSEDENDTDGPRKSSYSNIHNSKAVLISPINIPKNTHKTNNTFVSLKMGTPLNIHTETSFYDDEI
jgi:hypothetical protein